MPLGELKELCIKAGLPEPELRIKMWVTVVSIEDHYNKCYPDAHVSIQMAKQWVEGYIKEKQ